MDGSLKHICQTGNDIRDKILRAQRNGQSHGPYAGRDRRRAEPEVLQRLDQEEEEGDIQDDICNQTEDRLPPWAGKESADARQEPEADHQQRNLRQKDHYRSDRKQIETLLPFAGGNIVVNRVSSD